MIDAKKYIGREYDKTKFNCYSLVREIQKDLGRNLPDIDAVRIDSFAGRASIVQEEQKNTRYTRIDKPVDGCIVLMRFASLPTHCGVYLGNGQVIHNIEGRGVVIDMIDSLDTTGFYNVANC